MKKRGKASIINETITKGLNPTVEMKNSGVQWIGDVPDNWRVSRMRYFIDNIVDLDHYMPESVYPGIPYVMTGDLKPRVSQIDFESCKHISESDYDLLSKKGVPQVGDIIFARYATIGTVCYVDMESRFLVSYSCVTIKQSCHLNGMFLYYYLQTTAFLNEVQQYINTNTQSNVGKDALLKAKIVVPQLTEQDEIVAYLNEKCPTIDSIIAEKQSLITDLEAYKRSLIYEVVTGKRKVV